MKLIDDEETDIKVSLLFDDPIDQAVGFLDRAYCNINARTPHVLACINLN